MEFIRLTTRNAHLYLNYPIVFKTRGEYIIKKILGVNQKTIRVDHPDLHNNLDISREIYVLVN